MNIARYYYNNGLIQLDILFIIIIITLTVYFLITSLMKDLRPKLFLATLFLGIFFYSGFGIAYEDINNRFIYHYTIFLVSFGVPFIFCRNIKQDNIFSPFDKSLIENSRTLSFLAYFYLFLNLVPLIIPEFRLFDIFTFKSASMSIHVLKDLSRGNVYVSLADTLAVLLAPFFYAYFTITQEHNPKTNKPLILYIILIILQFGRYNYIPRYMMMTDLANILLLTFCVKGFYYKIKLKHIMIGLFVAMFMIPILYLYTYFRSGDIYVGNTSFSTLFDLLIKSEAYYPAFYSDILRHLEFLNESITGFISYVLCLPIPSFIWSSKPSYTAITSFTYMITGYTRGETGFYILLPSIMGESFIIGGEKWFWLFSLSSGTAISLTFRYLCSKKCLTFYSFIILVLGFSYARGGTMVLLPILINGSVAIFIYDLYVKKKSKKRKSSNL